MALRSELMSRGHEVRIITPLPRGYQGPRHDHTIFLGTSADVKYPFHTTAQVSINLKNDEIDRMLAREQFDIMHFHEPWVPLMSRQLLNRSKSVNVATFHAKLPENSMSKTIERAIIPYTKSLMKYLDGLTAVSDAAADYVRTLTSKPIEIIPNGIDLNIYKQPATGLEKPNGEPAKMILYIGRLERRKGVKYLLEAFRALAQADKDLQLYLAGDGPDRVKLEEFVRVHSISRVTFLGYVTEPQKIELLSRARLFCSPALYGESFGIVLLEAMAMGVVTVAGNNSGYSMVLKERGIISLVNPRETTEFARRMNLLLNDDEIRQLWQAWAKDYVKQFNYRDVAGQYEAAYRRIAKEKGAVLGQGLKK